MQITFQSRGVTLTPASREHIEARIRSALARCEERVFRIRVLLEDLDTDATSSQKTCQIQVELGRLPGVVAENHDVDLYAAITRCALKVGRSVKRRLSKELARSRDFGKLAWSGDLSRGAGAAKRRESARLAAPAVQRWG
jgi:ribosomal subunit interface protein